MRIKGSSAAWQQAAPKQASQYNCKASNHLRILFWKCSLNPKNIAQAIAEAAAALVVSTNTGTSSHLKQMNPLY